MHISLFITCYNDTLFPRTGRAVVAVLERLGHTVEFRQAQTCCGQMHYNTGYQAEAKGGNEIREQDRQGSKAFGEEGGQQGREEA